MWLFIFLLSILIIFLIPRIYLGLYIWFFIVLYAVYSFPSSYPYMDKSGADAFGEAILYIITSAVVSGIIIGLLIVLLLFFLNRNLINDRSSTEQSRLVYQVTSIAYGILLGYYIFLFLTYFLKAYQPAWEAYGILIIVIILFLIFSHISQRYFRYSLFNCLKYLYLFFVSLSLTMIFLAVNSFAFTIITLKQTNKIIGKYNNQSVKYCIQPKIDTWLELTPLTTWNKRSSDWGAGTNHAVLVVQNSKAIELYNWSYKSRKWDYLTTGFSPSSFNSPSSLLCTLESNYLNKLPFLFPKSTLVNIGKKKLDIPPKYFVREKKDSLSDNSTKNRQAQKTITFLATIPYFSSIKQILTKLPERYRYHTNISVSTVVRNSDLKNESSPFWNQNVQELEGEFGLNKRVLPKTQYLPKITRYYRVTDGAIDTVIDCLTDTDDRMNCQHLFVHNGLKYNFSHSEKDLKNWYDLQTNLIDLVESWEIP